MRNTPSALRPIDRAVLAALLSVWLICTVLHAHYASRDRSAWLVLGAEIVGPEDADSYPRIGRVDDRHWWAMGWAEASGLRPGDRLVRLGAADLRGVGTIGFYARAAEQASDDHWVSATVERNGEVREGEWSLLVPRTPTWWWNLPAATLGVAVGTLLLLRAPGSRAARALFDATLCFGILMNASFFGGPYLLTYLSLAILGISTTLLLPCYLRAAFSFPDEAAWTAPWTTAVTWLAAPLVPVIWGSILFGRPLSTLTAARLMPAVMLVASLALVAIFTLNYRRSGPIGRRQLKWILLGIYAASIPLIVARIAAIVDPQLYWLPETASIAGILVPVSFLVAIARYNLLDIDRVFSSALSATTVGVAVAAILLGVSSGTAYAASSFGVPAGLGHGAVLVLATTALLPVYPRLRRGLERRLFSNRHLTDEALAHLIEEPCETHSVDEACLWIADRLERVWQVESCVVYTRGSGAYTASRAHGRTVAVPIEDDGPMARLLRTCSGPLALNMQRPRGLRRELSPFERATLETLGAEIVLPIHAGEQLGGFICLGRKLSGDVYTTTDVALLAAVAAKAARVSTEGGSAKPPDDAGATDDETSLHARLRRYVPGAVAARVEAGRELTTAESDVSVMFVDIRGFTSYAASHDGLQVFSTINRYTTSVSRIISRHSGCVVEFNGDGMMALFGAPEVVPNKAGAALGAAREIVALVTSTSEADSGSPPLSLGIGIATGRAFVGNIQAADRLIWTAIGSVVNLASRLQSLTRQLDAWVAIDATTLQSAGSMRRGFERREHVTIRGLAEPETVYVLPLHAGSHVETRIDDA